MLSVGGEGASEVDNVESWRELEDGVDISAAVSSNYLTGSWEV